MQNEQRYYKRYLKIKFQIYFSIGGMTSANRKRK